MCVGVVILCIGNSKSAGNLPDFAIQAGKPNLQKHEIITRRSGFLPDIYNYTLLKKVM